MWINEKYVQICSVNEMYVGAKYLQDRLFLLRLQSAHLMNI